MNKIMQFARLNHHMRSKRLSKSTFSKMIRASRFSTTTDSTQVKETVYEDEEVANLQPRIRRRKPRIEPFVKELFLGRFKGEMLAFPEITNKEEHNELYLRVKMIESVFANNTTVEDINAKLKKFKIFGAPATVFHGGLESLATERCKMLETLAENVNVALCVKNHWMGLNLVKEGYPKDLLDEIMPELAAGDLTVNFCIKEGAPDKPNLPDLRCKAEMDHKKQFLIYGEKIFDKPKEGYLAVVCDVDHEPLQTFLVHPGAANVHIRSPSITFKNTPATRLGIIEDHTTDILNSHGATFMKNVIAQNRLETAAIASGLLRNVITHCVAAIRGKHMAGSQLAELQLIQKAVFEAVMSLYAIESMVYFTAGLFDGYEDPDIDIEAAICRTYATKKTFKAIYGLINAIGTDILADSMFKYADDARTLLLLEEQNDKIDVFAALTGLKCAGEFFAEEVSDLRNPFQKPKATIRKLFSGRRDDNDNPKLDLFLKEHVHPALQDAADRTEYCVKRLRYATERLFLTYGPGLMDEHRSHARLMEAVADTYAGITSLSRASRAYCIGLHMSENEIAASDTLTELIRQNVQRLVLEIDHGIYINYDAVREDIATKTLKYKKSHFEHCLERVFF